MRKKKKQLFLVFLLLLSIYSTAAVVSADLNQRIRVGCIDIDNFLVTSDEGYTSGYAADYLEKIAEYTNWEYEYVRGSWEECMQWLEEGKIDLLLPAERSAEREEKFLFSKEMCCMDYAALVGRKDDDIYYEDYAAFDGMRVGMIAENYLNGLFDDYAEKHGFSVEKVYYSTGTEENEALEKGEVDAIISGNMNFIDSQKLLARINFMPAYFITSINRPDLMEALDDAQNNINLENPYYTATLHEEYYGRIERQAVGFTREEITYMENIDKVQVYYDTDNYPLFYTDESTDKAAGIYVDILIQIFDGCGLKYEFVPWTEENSNEIQSVETTPNILFCTSESMRIAEKDTIDFTNGFLTVTYNLVGKRGANINLQDPLKVAVVSHNLGDRKEIEERYPDWGIVFADDMNECFDCVKNGTTDLAFVNSIVQEAHAGEVWDTELVNISADVISVDVCLAMSKSNDPLLKTILNKGIKKLVKEEVDQTVFNHILLAKPQITLSGLISSYPFVAIGIVIVICAILAIFVLICVQSVTSRKKNRILQEKNKELEEAIKVQHELQLENELDPLTGLKNKRTVQRLCAKILADSKGNSCTLLVVDIDNFKNINDVYGHLEGDRILAELAQCIDSAFAGQILGRIGGDEFMILLRDLEDDKELEKILDNFFDRLKKVELPTAVTCSVGAAVSKKSGEKFEDLFERADHALYVAKGLGKNQYLIEKL